MGLDTLRNELPGYAKDTKLNLGSVLGNSTYGDDVVWGTALASAYASRSAKVLREIHEEAASRLSAEALEAAKAAASIMAMNNIYYRAKHLLGDEEYDSMPAKLRMTVIGKPGVDQHLFELWSFAVSAITGCGMCLQSHDKTLRGGDTPRETIHEVLRIASVVHAAAVTLDAEDALPSAEG